MIEAVNCHLSAVSSPILNTVERAVFLDRDNTLIANDGDLGNPAQVRLIDGVAPALARLRDAGYRLVVVTNQAGVARGEFGEAEVNAVHERIARLAGDAARRPELIDRFYYCPYHPEGTLERYRRDHPWRKPHPGMLLQASGDMGLDLGRSWLIGDQPRDIAAGRDAGCRTILIGDNPALVQEAHPSATAPTFSEAVKLILHDPDGLGPSDPPLEGNPPAENAAGLRQALIELADEVRTERIRRGELTALRMAAGAAQLLVLLLVLLGLLQVGHLEAFIKWMISAALVQLLAITLLVADLKT